MTTFFTVHPGPQEYICASGVLATLPERLVGLNIKRVLIVRGTVSWEKSKRYLMGLLTSNIEVTDFHFTGEATDAVIAAIAEKAREMEVDAIIAVGGGKIQDVSKYAAYLCHSLPFISVPTLASNCAPWTSVTVVYNADGSMDRLEVLPVQATLLLIEPELVIDSPRDYFIAGMADTLAKWYESDAILSLPENQSSPMLLMARQAASLCRNVILEYGEAALADLEAGKLSSELKNIIEIIISISGTVGGFGDYLARTTIAHEIHDALTADPESHHFLHGHKVGYGILVQLAIEENWTEIEKLSAFYKRLGVPGSLREMGLDYLNDEQLSAIGEFVVRSDSPVSAHPANVTAEMVRVGMLTLENVNN